MFVHTTKQRQTNKLNIHIERSSRTVLGIDVAAGADAGSVDGLAGAHVGHVLSKRLGTAGELGGKEGHSSGLSNGFAGHSWLVDGLGDRGAPVDLQK